MKHVIQVILILSVLAFWRHDTFSKEGNDNEEKGNIIIFDFATKQFMSLEDTNTVKSKSPYCLNYQDDISIKVININLNKYEVTFDSVRRTYEYVSSSTDNEKSEESDVDNKTLEEKMQKQLEDMGIDISTMSLNDSIQFIIRIAKNAFDISQFDKLKSQLEQQVVSDLTALEGETFRGQYLSDFNEDKKELSKEFSLFKKVYINFKEKSKSNLTLAQVEKMEEAMTQAEKNIKSLEEISELFEGLKAENFWTLFTLTNIEDDLVIIKLTIKEKTDKDGKGETYSASIKVKGKWKIDASAGALFNLVSYDYNYFINGSNTIERGQSRQKITPVYPVALMHFYRKGEEQTSWGFSGGFGLTEDTKISFYIGGSALVGESQRWILTGGFSLRPVSRLKSQYTNGQDLSSLSSLPEETDLVEDIHQLGAFVSLTYNLSRKD